MLGLWPLQEAACRILNEIRITNSMMRFLSEGGIARDIRRICRRT
jgi:hypothetical protein